MRQPVRCEAGIYTHGAAADIFNAVLPPKKSKPLKLRLRQQPVQGLSVQMLYRILRRYRGSIQAPNRIKGVYHTHMAFLHTCLNFLENRAVGEKISRTELPAPPVFVLGHWRSGTTFLHNLLACDPGLGYPRAYQALFPGSFLSPAVKRVVPHLERASRLKTRPMDNVKFGLRVPWEDEFIMAGLTGISPYMRALFPRTLGSDINFRYPDLESEEECRIWKETFIRLMQRLTIIEKRRIVLKSPTHTARVKILLDLFPEAKFIHIIRNPFDVFSSNLMLWREALSLSFLERVTATEILEIILSTYNEVAERYWTQKDAIPAGNLVELRFEDLEKDPLGELRRTYRTLGLAGFDRSAPIVSTYLGTLTNYQKNRYNLPSSVKKMVYERWQQSFDRHGYAAS